MFQGNFFLSRITVSFVSVLEGKRDTLGTAHPEKGQFSRICHFGFMQIVPAQPCEA